MAEARGLGPRQCEFDSHRPYEIDVHRLMREAG